MFCNTTSGRLSAAVFCAVGLCAQAETNAPAIASSAPYRPPTLDAELTDGEIWNQGVDAYREFLAAEKGSSNRVAAAARAIDTLKPLLYQRRYGDLTRADPRVLAHTHGARAGELIAAIQSDLKDAAAAQDPATAAKAAEEAAAAMQVALRANPKDPRTNRNFTRATDRLEELREEAHIKEVLASSQGQGPDQQLGAGTQEARALLKEAQGVLTNAAPRLLAQSEALAKRAEKLADVWIPVKEGIVQAMAQNATNQQQLAYAVNEVEAAREATKKAADSLADLDPAAQTQLAQAEDALTRFWKMAILPPAAVAESIQAQTNSFLDAEKINRRPWQPEALDFTRAFRARFPMWAQQYEQQAQADTNKPPFTKEAQAEINALAGEVEKIQIAISQKEDPPSMLEALKKLERIRDLLPKDKNGGGSNNQPQANPQQNPDQDKDKQQDHKDDQKQDQPQQQDQQQQDQQQQQQEQKSEDKKDGQPPPKDDEVEALLQKAQDRNDQHENEKKARLRKVPLSPNERDW